MIVGLKSQPQDIIFLFNERFCFCLKLKIRQNLFKKVTAVKTLHACAIFHPCQRGGDEYIVRAWGGLSIS